MNERSLRTGNTFLVTGIVLIGFGLVALFSPVSAGDLVVKVTALMLIVIGLIRLVLAFRSKEKLEAIVATLLGAVILGLGVLVWLNPELGSGFLTALLTVFFVAHGAWKISTALHYRQYPAWGWLVLSALVSLLFAWLMWQQWPLSGAWSIGIFLGLDLIVTGIVSVLLARAIKRSRKSGSVSTMNL